MPIGILMGREWVYLDWEVREEKMLEQGIRAVVIAGVSSGSGKTTVVGAVAAELARRGLSVQVYKVGPDYIDPGHHGAITGRPVRSLDLWMMGEEGVRRNFARGLQGADVALVEGVGGLFDGMGTTEFASTAQVAKLLNLPVVLVVNAWGMSRSAAALVKGFADFDGSLNLSGVMFNLVGSEGHAGLLESSIRSTGVRSLGHLLRKREGVIPERHLGLRLAGELDWEDRRDVLLDLASTIDVDGLLSISALLPRPPDRPGCWISRLGDLRLAVAKDSAFAFVYQESLEALKEAGAELLFFSPVKGQGIPSSAQALYLPGGYPELYGEALQENALLKEELRAFAGSGCPIYAECGGLIYLSNSVEYRGQVFQMAGLLPLSVSFGGRPLLGYARGDATNHHPFLPAGQQVRGHVFHYSVTSESCPVRHAYRLGVPTRDLELNEGYVVGKTVATYLHLNLAFAPRLVEGIWEAAGA